MLLVFSIHLESQGAARTRPFAELERRHAGDALGAHRLRARARRAAASLLVALSAAISVIGPRPAAMFAAASTFFVLALDQRGQGLLRYCAGLSALLAVAFAVEPIFGSVALHEAAISTFGAMAQAG